MWIIWVGHLDEDGFRSGPGLHEHEIQCLASLIAHLARPRRVQDIDLTDEGEGQSSLIHCEDVTDLDDWRTGDHPDASESRESKEHDPSHRRTDGGSVGDAQHRDQ